MSIRCEHGFEPSICPDRLSPTALRDMEDMRRLAYGWAVERYGLDRDEAEDFATYCAREVARLGEMPERGFDSMLATYRASQP